MESRVSTSSSELRQAGIAYVVLTVDLPLILGKVGIYDRFDPSFLPWLLTSAVAALTGFAAHELAPKVSAE